MIGSPIVIGKRKADEAEKPFWISFSDLMSALMVLFLVVMTVALLTVTQHLRDVQKAAGQRQQEINEILERLKDSARDFPQVHISTERMTIDFGEVGRFASGSDALTPEALDLLRGFIPRVLAEARSALGQKWFKRVIVEGFTDTDGSYLFNLDLSLRRAQRVVCTLLTPGAEGRASLTDDEMAHVRRLFSVGGFSFNSSKESKEESRRIELRLDFRALHESNQPGAGPTMGRDLATIEVGRCQLR
ncbi:OmpA/MotB family protein [Azospirillum halopraeferens]|uniref:OmpA/MotB family protein n=1 Tax=Azospirillum halopraeferens TaxID=34010 RepID=UPI0003FCC522|nr:OmpA family protein [Azospirillum halopraeferens]